MRRTKRKITGKWGHWPRKWGVSWDRAHPPQQLPEGIHWGPGIPESSSHHTHHPQPPPPQLMGLKGKGYRAGLSGNDRKKRGEAGGGGGCRAWVGDGLSRPSRSHPKAVLQRWGPHIPFSRMSSAPSSHWSSSSYSSSTSATRKPSSQGGSCSKGDLMTVAAGRHHWEAGMTTIHLSGQDREARTGEALARSHEAASSHGIGSPMQPHLHQALKATPPPTPSTSPLKNRIRDTRLA